MNNEYNSACFDSYHEFAEKHESKHGEAQFFAAVIRLITEYGNTLFTDQQGPALTGRFNIDSDIATIFSLMNDIFTGSLHVAKAKFDPDVFLAFERDLVGTNDHIQKGTKGKPTASLSGPECADVIRILWKAMQEWAQNQAVDLLTLIDEFVEIGQRRGIYGNCVVCVDGVEVNDKTSAVTFFGHLLSGKQEPIAIHGRPGGIEIRRRVLCLSTINRKSLIGSMVHRCNDSEEEFSRELECDKSLCNTFFVFMLNRYVEQDREHFVEVKRTLGDTDVILLGPSYRLVYFPKDKDADGIIKNAIDKVSLIIPFVPRSVLFPVQDLGAVEVFSYSTVSYLRDVHLFEPERKDRLPNVYRVTRALIDYMLTKLHDLASFDKVYRFAVTGNGCWKDIHPGKVSKNRTVVSLPYLFDHRVNTLVLLVNSDQPDISRYVGDKMRDPWKPPKKLDTELPCVPNLIWSLRRTFLVELDSCWYAPGPKMPRFGARSFVQLMKEEEERTLKDPSRVIKTLFSGTARGAPSFDVRRLPPRISELLVPGQHAQLHVKGYGHAFVDVPCKKDTMSRK